MIAHEYEQPVAVWKKYNFDWDGIECKKRSWVICNIHTVGEDYPIAVSIRCNMLGLGKYEGQIYESYTATSLGIVGKNNAKENTEEALRGIITEISMQILEERNLPKTK